VLRRFAATRSGKRKALKVSGVETRSRIKQRGQFSIAATCIAL
jgi:hypothetical protein